MLLDVRNLSVSFRSDYGLIDAVKAIDFTLEENKTLCIVGESGSGKSVTSLSIMGLLDENAIINSGEIYFNDRDLLTLSKKELKKIVGSQISMIFQEPMTSLNPSLTIGYQIGEVLKIHEPHLSKKEHKKKIIESLEMVKIKNPEQRAKEYPFKLSGGQRQRVMIAQAMVCKPKLLIADEPTTALDVTIQAEVIRLMKELQNEHNMSILLITHDLGVVSGIADNIAVMYKGVVVETGSAKDVLYDPRHPYTKALIGAIPEAKKPKQRLDFVDENVDYLSFKKEIR
ncbi:ABC transporter ATP-binding protein [uncultured Campylobacter sp.]|uniref:ABC transporter ATP-binding protein n=1 Tax=uncultured Campylobacter sp. TaxID=218934 RepID=UPI002619A401|nr:ABC transporter ATP-binding protein [uncultured Campylobacter sp.]